MLIEVVRRIFTEHSTIGDLLINGEPECFSLEDADLGLNQDMNAATIKEKKIPGKTAIPSGKYEITVDLSARFGKLMPHILNVPGFDGIRIHTGNTDKDVEGCLALGTSIGEDYIGESVLAFNRFFPKLREAVDHSKCYIIIRREGEVG